METAVGLALIATAIATLAAGGATVVLAFLVGQAVKDTRTMVDDIRAKIETNNGLTVGEMVQHNYSMAAQDVPVGDRTEEQHTAVGMLTDQEHTTHAEAAARRPPDSAPT